ncbi:MAG: hypothetical protein U1F55_10345 [Chitinivorax sp.]
MVCPLPKVTNPDLFGSLRKVPFSSPTPRDFGPWPRRSVISHGHPHLQTGNRHCAARRIDALHSETPRQAINEVLSEAKQAGRNRVAYAQAKANTARKFVINGLRCRIYRAKARFQVLQASARALFNTLIY